MRRAVVPLLLALVALSVRAEAPLTTADVVRFLRAGISESTILTELGSRGFGEPIDLAREAALQEAGASDTLMAALRRATPTPRPTTAPRSASPVPAAPAPTRPEATVANAPTFAVSTRTVRVPVFVLDPEGKPVLGLHGADFKISENGKRQGVSLFSGQRGPLRIALVLDLSLSMDNKIRQVEEALRHFIDLLEPADEIMVMTFAGRLRLAQDFTSDRQKLMKVLENLELGEGTALYDAAFESIRRVGQGPAESKAVVLVTDGVDTSSALAFKDVKELARRREVPVFSIGLDSGNERRSFSGGRGGPGRGRPPGGGFSGKAFDEKPLTELAEETGGRVEIVKGLAHYTPDRELPGSDRLKEAVESIALTLRHRYLLGYEPPAGKSGWRTIRVDVGRADATARARKGYYAGG